jgi:hypothetical protein
MSTGTPRKKAPRKAQPAAAAPTQVTAASAWKKSSEVVTGHLVTLPSGNVARLRRTLNLPTLLRTGKIPNPLAGYVNDAIKTRNPSVQPKQEDQEAIVQMVQLIQGQIPIIFLEPKVQVEPGDWDVNTQGVWEPDEDAINILDLDPEDAMFAFAFAQGGPADVARFREEQAKVVASMADEQGVEGASVESAGAV